MLSLIFPSHCLACKKTGPALCTDCKKQLKPHPELCPFCHRVSKHYLSCLHCYKHYPHLQGCLIGFQYTSVLKHCVWQIKYNHRRSLAPFLAERLSFLIQTHPLLVDAYDKGNLVVTRVPSHRRRTWWVKGYNQSELLARSLAKKLDIPCIQICKKNKYTTSQTKLSREERLTNLYDSFHYIDKNDTQLENKTMLIIDDITTTGATIYELAKTIKKHLPTNSIWGVVLGRHGK